jgi:methylated-DNA-protein-cysteine methyltransferase related protein
MGKNCINQEIIDAIRRIPYGSVSSYGEVAAMAGLPGRARLVARVLSKSEDDGLPWHRVLRSSGQIAFPPGSDRFLEQAGRLRSEGLEVKQGRVKRDKKPLDLDALLWAPDARNRL